MVARCVSPECTKAAGRADSFVVSADYTGQNTGSDRRGSLVPARVNFALQAHSELYAGQKNDRHHEKQQLLLDFSRRVLRWLLIIFVVVFFVFVIFHLQFLRKIGFADSIGSFVENTQPFCPSFQTTTDARRQQ